MIIVNFTLSILCIFLAGMHFGAIITDYYEGTSAPFTQYAWVVSLLLYGVYGLISVLGSTA